MKKLFGTDGIRGRANQWPITPEMALKAGRAIARALRHARGGRSKIVIGKDTRLSGYMLETALTSGLVAEGATVLLVGPMPTAAVAHLTRTMDCVAGMVGYEWEDDEYAVWLQLWFTAFPRVSVDIGM